MMSIKVYLNYYNEYENPEAEEDEKQLYDIETFNLEVNNNDGQQYTK